MESFSPHIGIFTLKPNYSTLWSRLWGRKTHTKTMDNDDEDDDDKNELQVAKVHFDFNVSSKKKCSDTYKFAICVHISNYELKSKFELTNFCSTY